MAEEAKGALAPLLGSPSVAEILARPVDNMTPAELLARASVRGLQQLYAIIDAPLDPDDVKQRRLIGDMAFAANKLFQRAASGERHDDVLRRLAELMEAEAAKDRT